AWGRRIGLGAGIGAKDVAEELIAARSASGGASKHRETKSRPRGPSAKHLNKRAHRWPLRRARWGEASTARRPARRRSTRREGCNGFREGRSRPRIRRTLRFASRTRSDRCGAREAWEPPRAGRAPLAGWWGRRLWLRRGTNDLVRGDADATTDEQRVDGGLDDMSDLLAGDFVDTRHERHVPHEHAIGAVTREVEGDAVGL